ncbi:MAG: helix-turn-helix transcriptional regulator, partial [Nocardioides sp.]
TPPPTPQRKEPVNPHTDPASRRPAPAQQATAVEEHLTLPEVCAELKTSRSTFYYWRQTGRAPQCIRLPNGELRITRTDLHAWLRAHTETAASEQDHHQ